MIDTHEPACHVRAKKAADAAWVRYHKARKALMSGKRDFRHQQAMIDAGEAVAQSQKRLRYLGIGI